MPRLPIQQAVLYLGQLYLSVAESKEDLRRRLRHIALERELLGYTYGTDLYWQTLEKIRAESS